MRTTGALLLLLFTATSAFAAPPAREPFPSDFAPQSCAPESGRVCRSFAQKDFVSAAFNFLGLTIDGDWLQAHWNEMTEAFLPICRKQAHCYAIRGNGFTFCNDVVMPEARKICDAKYSASADREQCRAFVETYALGVDQNSKALWEETQACAASAPAPTRAPALEVWMTPEKLPRDYKGYITVYALDPLLRMPVPARITIENQRLYAPANPAGFLSSYYPFKWPVKLNRTPNAAGHRDVVAPLVTLQAEGYPPVTFRMPYDVPKMNVTLTPAPARLTPGRNRITVTATDAETGQPVEARVLFGETILGETNHPLELTLPKGKRRPEIWVTSLFDRYSDVVVAPAVR